MNGPPVQSPAAGRREHLVMLAQSVNDTARMVRANVSLTLIVALYLALTLLSATDENLFRNSVVTLPQFETGISLSRSYLFAPVAFLYLHLQTLFLLTGLVRKVRAFETAVGKLPAGDERTAADYMDWLSAVSLVQGLRRTGNFAAAARILAWTGTVGIPVLLLFLIDTSFLRHQSGWTSLVHHACFTADLAGAWIFWRSVGPGGSRPDRKAGTRSMTAVRAAAKMAAWSCSIASLALLWSFAWPKAYPEHESGWFHNPFDWICGISPWRGFCRTMDLTDATLVRAPTGTAMEGLPDEVDQQELDRRRRLFGLDLRRRSFRFVELDRAYLPAARLDGADLRGASLSLAQLHGADLSGAGLHGADLFGAKLHGARLIGAELHGASLSGAKLQGADLSRAKLHGADLSWAELHGADLTWAKLQGADLTWAKLRRPDLEGLVPRPGGRFFPCVTRAIASFSA